MKSIGQFAGNHDFWSGDFQFKFFINFHEKVTYYTTRVTNQDFELSYKADDGFCNFKYTKDEV